MCAVDETADRTEERRPWLPPEFEHPHRVDLRAGPHLRPIRAADVEIDYPAVMGSRERLWARYGEAWGWPPATMTFEQDRADLARHEREIASGLSFNYAVLDEAETELLGCVYLDPPDPGQEVEAVVSWWVVDDHAAGPLAEELEGFVPEWVTTAWPFSSVAFRP